MNVTTKRSFGLLAAGVAAAGMSWGQESDAVGRSTMRTIEEVVITATRREQDSQTVPVSVNAFSASMLEERTVRDLGDLTKIAPGIRFVHQGGGGNMNVVMRGLARIPIGTAPNAVINYFADVPLSFQGSNIPTYDLASIQVLKGPQGTLFGSNAMAGAV
ncbi:MAG: Plug domain-containing protein, partial [Porticoccaceae bacterium]